MARQKHLFYGRILLTALEVLLIGFSDYAKGNYIPLDIAHYISLDVLYCLPIIQAARISAIHATRRSDTQTSTLVGIAIALAWSSTEAAIAWPGYPLNAFLLNTFTRSVVFTVIGRVVTKLSREREYARKDMLTSLANRVELVERLEAEQIRSERSGSPFSLLFIDVDQFKALNDTHGHHVGDEALKVLADILRESSRKVDVVSRFGGDEFVLLLPDTDEGSCDTLVKRIEASTDKEFQDRSWPISVSIGRITQTGRQQNMDWVLRAADENMYKVKGVRRTNGK